LDAAARRVMRDEGVEDLFTHSLGHGIGLETHEFPRISQKADERDTVLKEGMVITIEPGLYATGICGVRYEDTVIVWKEGPENLYQDLNLEK
jgi:Xaa-Pro aminopeptidase